MHVPFTKQHFSFEWCSWQGEGIWFYDMYPLPNNILSFFLVMSSLYQMQSLLRQEIEQLKYLVEHHPDGSRLSRENMNLKTELKQLRASVTKGVGPSSARQLEQSHRYTLQLERQLRHYLARGNNSEFCGGREGNRSTRAMQHMVSCVVIIMVRV